MPSLKRPASAPAKAKCKTKAKAKPNEPQAKAVPPVEGEEEMSPEAASIVLESMGGPDGFVPANPSLAAIYATVTEACQEALALPRLRLLLLAHGVLTSGPRPDLVASLCSKRYYWRVGCMSTKCVSWLGGRDREYGTGREGLEKRDWEGGTGTGREALQETDWEGAETCLSLLSQADFKKEELAKDKKKGKKKWSKQDWIDPELKIMGGGCGH